MLFCGDYKDVFMTAIAIIWLSTSDTMLCSKKSIIKSCQEGTFYLEKKKKLSLNVRESLTNVKTLYLFKWFCMNLEIIVSTNIWGI